MQAPLPLCSAMASRRVFSQALLHHLVGNQISPTLASVEMSRIACGVLGQALCGCSGTSYISQRAKQHQVVKLGKDAFFTDMLYF